MHSYLPSLHHLYEKLCPAAELNDDRSVDNQSSPHYNEQFEQVTHPTFDSAEHHHQSDSGGGSGDVRRFDPRYDRIDDSQCHLQPANVGRGERPKKLQPGAQAQQAHLERVKIAETSQHSYLEKSVEELRLLSDNQRNDIYELQTCLDYTSALLATKTAQLEAVQQYLTTADAASDADVLELVENLNAEISSAATHIASSMTFGDSGEPFVGNAAMRGEVDRWVGSKMMDLLTSFKYREDTTFVQIVLEACMVMFSQSLITSWDSSRDADNSWEEMYKHIRESKSQIIASQWRALTRSQLAAINAESVEENVITLQRELASLVTDVLVVCGVPPHSADTVAQSFSKKLGSIIQLNAKIRRSIGEEILSCDLETTVASHGDPFQRMLHEDAHPIGRDPVQDGTTQVLCSTGLGLRRIEPRVVGAVSQPRLTVLSKSKVALVTLVDELMAEIDSGVSS